jgi:exopolysaccharide production protein ExoQ
VTDARTAPFEAPLADPRFTPKEPTRTFDWFGRVGILLGSVFFALLLVSFNPFPTDVETYGVDQAPSIFKLAGYAALAAFAGYYLVSMWRLLGGARLSTFVLSSPYMLVLLCLAAVSTIWSVSPNDSITEAVKLFLFLSLMTFYTQGATTPRQAADVVYYACVLLLVLSVIGCLVMPERAIHRYGFTGGEVWVNKNLAGTWRGIFFHKNYAGGVIMFVIMLGLPRLFEGRWIARGVNLLILGLAAAFLIKTKSNTSVLAPVVGGAIALLFVCVPLLTKAFGSVYALLFTALIAAFPALVVYYLNPVYGFDADGRAHIWSVNFQAWANRPLEGYGYLAAYSENTPLADFDNQEFASRIGSHAHNGLIDMMNQLGIMGMALYLGFVFLLVRAAIVTVNGSRDFRTWLFSSALLWAVLAGFVRASFEPDFMRSRGNFYILAFLFIVLTRSAPLLKFGRGKVATAIGT